MPDGGRLTVRTGNAALDARAAARHPDAPRPGAYVFAEVADTGHGMPAEVLERAAEPFFTTKEPGKGTGLGLSQVYGFARQSGGFLSIASAPGAGTTVGIHLPGLEAGADAPPPAEAEARGGSGTVLVVEDDADVRDLAAEQLEELGYAVLTAASGPEALAVLSGPGAAGVDLLLTDMVMPGGMSGVELAREARARLPGLRAVLASGYVAGGAPGADGPGAADLPLLPKPYAAADLARVVREALGGG